MRGVTWKVLVCIVLVGVFLLFLTQDPSKSRLFPKCLFHVLTGLNCPGCGSQRALHALLNLDIRTAVGYNALMVCSIPFLMVLTVAGLSRSGHPRLYAALTAPAAIAVYLAVILLWWLLRNLFGL